MTKHCPQCGSPVETDWMKCDDCGFQLVDVDEEDLPEEDEVDTSSGSSGSGGEDDGRSTGSRSTFLDDFVIGLKLLVVGLIAGMTVWFLFKLFLAIAGVSTRYGSPDGMGLVLFVFVIFSIWLQGAVARSLYGWE